MNSAQKPHIVQLLLLGASFSCALASALCGFLYYDFYWRYRDLFDADGRYFDEKDLVVHHDQSAVFIVPTIAFLLLAALFAAIWVARRRSMVAQVANGP